MSAIAASNAVLTWIVILVNLLLTFGLVRRLKKLSEMMAFEEEVGLTPGEQAPNFQAETLEGGTLSLADFARKAVCLVFFSPSCSPCIDKLPALNILRPKAEKAGVELLLVSTDGDREELVALVKKHALDLPVLLAPMQNNSFAADYKAFATPSFCSLDPEGQVKEAGTFGDKWEQAFVESWAT